MGDSQKPYGATVLVFLVVENGMVMETSSLCEVMTMTEGKDGECITLHRCRESKGLCFLFLGHAGRASSETATEPI